MNQPQLRENQKFLTGLVSAGYVAGMVGLGLRLGLYRAYRRQLTLVQEMQVPVTN